MATRKQLRALAKARRAKKHKNRHKSKSKICMRSIKETAEYLRRKGYKVVKK